MYGSVYRNFLFPTYEFVRGRRMLRHLRELERTQWLPSDEIASRRLQVRRRV